MSDAVECQLVRHVEYARPAAAWLVALHDDGGDAGSLVELARRVAPHAPRCCAQGPFSRNAFLGSGHDAGTWGAYRGYGWFRHDLDGAIESVSFADGVAQVEALVAELRDTADAAGVYLLGVGDGATVARRVRGVDGIIAIGGEDVAARDVPVLALATPDVAAITAWLHARTTTPEVAHGLG